MRLSDSEVEGCRDEESAGEGKKMEVLLCSCMHTIQLVLPIHKHLLTKEGWHVHVSGEEEDSDAWKERCQKICLIVNVSSKGVLRHTDRLSTQVNVNLGCKR